MIGVYTFLAQITLTCNRYVTTWNIKHRLLNMLVFWVLTQCGTNTNVWALKMEAVYSYETSVGSLPTNTSDVTTDGNRIDTFTAVRTSFFQDIAVLSLRPRAFIWGIFSMLYLKRKVRQMISPSCLSVCLCVPPHITFELSGRFLRNSVGSSCYSRWPERHGV
jgi:hypothetical protein